MPFIPHTPEALLPRSDSKNPASTCKGLTFNGRPCRRAIAASVNSSKGIRLSGIQDDSSLYCWQHKDQVVTSMGLATNQSMTIQERNSIDTLVDRLGIVDLTTDEGKHRDRLPKTKPVSTEEKHGSKHSQPPKSRPKARFRLLCCVGIVDDGESLAIAPRPSRPNTHEKTSSNQESTSGSHAKKRQKPVTQNTTSSNAQVSYTHLTPTHPPKRQSQQRPSLPRDPSSKTSEYLSFIPASTSPLLASLLLAELAKPISTADEEGFIYMFWLTPDSLPTAPATRTASSLLVPISDRPRGADQRRTSDVLRSFSNAPSSADAGAPSTILLKIGRASNVQRRLNEWTRQCGYNLSLIRYYPYHGSDSSPSPSPSPSRGASPGRRPSGPAGSPPVKVPHAHKVERLIHIELSRKKFENSGKCGSCGKEHREWFEVEASRKGVRDVDKVIRRWVDWSVQSA